MTVNMPGSSSQPYLRSKAVLRKLLDTKKGATAAVKMTLRTRILEQFRKTAGREQV